MATRKQFINRCNELGVIAIDSGDMIRIDAPHGRRFAGTQCHYHDIYLRGWTRPDAYQAMIDDMRMGLETCDITDCEICEDAYTPEQIAEFNGGELMTHQPG